MLGVGEVGARRDRAAAKLPQQGAATGEAPLVDVRRLAAEPPAQEAPNAGADRGMGQLTAFRKPHQPVECAHHASPAAQRVGPR